MKVDKLIPCNCHSCKLDDAPFFFEYAALRRRIDSGRYEVECGKSYEMINVPSLIDDVIDQRYFSQERGKEVMDGNLQVTVQQAGQIIIQNSERGVNIMENNNGSIPAIKSSWANGSFFLFAFVIVIGGLGFLAGKIPLFTLTIIIIAGILIVPMIGAFQLRQDERLSEKSLLELVRMVFGQLPLIGKMISKGNND